MTCFREQATGLNYLTADDGSSDFMCPDCPEKYRALCHKQYDPKDKQITLIGDEIIKAEKIAKEQVWVLRAKNGNAVRLRTKEDLAYASGSRAKRDEDGAKEIFVDYLKDDHDIMRWLVDGKHTHILLKPETFTQKEIYGGGNTAQISLMGEIVKPKEFERIKACESDNESGEEGDLDENGNEIEPKRPDRKKPEKPSDFPDEEPDEEEQETPTPLEADREIAEELKRMDEELDRKQDELKCLEEMEELKLKLANLEQNKGGKYHTELPYSEPAIMDRRKWMAKNRPELVAKAKELKELSDLVVEMHGGKDNWFGGSDYWFGVYWGVDEQ